MGATRITTQPGNLAFTTDPLGLISATGYDLLGRATVTVADWTASMGPVVAGSLPTPTDSSNQTTEYAYDGDNHVIMMTAVMPSDETSQITHYVYGVTTAQGSSVDDNDLLYEVQYPDPASGTNTSSGTYNQGEFYKYDGTGEQTGYTDRNGTAHAYSYDQLGRLTLDSVTLASGSTVDNTVLGLGYAYNDAGQMSLATSYNSSSGTGVLNQIAETYDGFGQLASDAQAVSGSVVTGTTPTVGYSYDAANDDRQTGITYPDGRAISYNYSSGIDSIMSQISSVRDSSGNLQAYTYLGLDTPVTFTDGNGVALSYLGTLGSTSGDAGDQYTGLDRFGRVIEQNWTGPYLSGPAVYPGVDQFEYGYDQDGNVVYKNAVTDTTSSTTNTTLASESQLFTYDNLNRLSNFSSGTLTFNGSTASISGTATETEGWTLDALGNWESSSVTTGGTTTTTSRTNSAQNQVKTVGSATLAYDSDGNTSTDETGQEYVYDAWNRLVEVKNASGAPIANYSYDAEGRRMTQTEAGVTTDLYYSNRWQVVQENVGSLVTAQHVWSPFYVDDMIETDTNPDVTTAESNGSVDTSFGTSTGTHTTTTSLSSSPTSAVSAIDGSDIVVAAMVGSTPELLWYNSSGGLDTAYGSGTGIVSLSFTGWTAITGIVVQPSGKIDLAVTTSSGGMNVAQLTSAGAADTSFGSSGLETLSSLPAAKGIVLAPNGDLLVAGLSTATFKVEELSPSAGTPDTSYNTSGTASILANSNGSTIIYIGMALQPDGDLLLSGRYVVSGTPTRYYLAMVAITPAGQGDSSFGTSGSTSGRVTQEWGLPYAPGDTPMAVSPTGEILIGYASSHSGALFLGVYEFNPDGSINSSFGTDGFAHANLSSGSTNIILAIETNGQIVIGDGSGSGTFTLVRFDSNGTLDTTFGSSGIESGASESGGLAMITAANGETVMVGTPTTGSGIILQEFHTLANAQRLYVEQDADYGVTSLTDSSGNVVERYEYDPYGNVTVLNPNGTVRGDGSAASSFYGWVYLHQGLRRDVLTNTDYDRFRFTIVSLGRFGQVDPIGAAGSGTNLYQQDGSNPINRADPAGEMAPPAAKHTTTAQLRAIMVAQALAFQQQGFTLAASFMNWYATTPCKTYFLSNAENNLLKKEVLGDSNVDFNKTLGKSLGSRYPNLPLNVWTTVTAPPGSVHLQYTGNDSDLGKAFGSIDLGYTGQIMPMGDGTYAYDLQFNLGKNYNFNINSVRHLVTYCAYPAFEAGNTLAKRGQAKPFNILGKFNVSGFTH